MPTMILIDLLRFSFMVLEVRLMVMGAGGLLRAFFSEPTALDLWRISKDARLKRSVTQLRRVSPRGSQAGTLE